VRNTLAESTLKRWFTLTLGGLLLVALGLRVYQLAAQSLWYDEGVSWYLTRLSLPQLTVWTANDIQPPLYYYLLWVWVRLAGTSEYALRFPSAAWGVLAIPLAWQIGRRLAGRWTGWLGALLLAASSLHVYYAQEARMYTLLAGLGLLSSYLLLRLETGRRRRLTAAGYVLSATAALYTHYFALFLLVAHALYALLRHGRRIGQWGCRTAAIPAAIILLYVPWLPFVVSRYGLDTSYWPGPLPLGESARQLFIAFGTGETVSQPAANWLALGYGLILLASLVAWMARPQGPGRRGSARRAMTSLPLVFLLIYLLVPLALTLMVSYQTPKFNPRYAMLASPAFVLLIAGGVAWLLSASVASRPLRRLFFALAALSLGYVLATNGYALANWYAPYPVNQFNKADFRITAGIVRERIRPDETVLLSSGHMFPAWAYYYGWQGWQRLPDIEVLDVRAALDLGVGDRLSQLLRGRRGVWLVRWQNQVTDPWDVLPLYLGTQGVQDDYGQFWHMELAHYQLPAGAAFDASSFVEQPVSTSFGGEIELFGTRRISRSQLVLVWRAVSPPQADYTVFAHLLDPAGVPLANADHFPAVPARQWPVGRLLPDRVNLALPADLPAGRYQVEVGLYNPSEPGGPRLEARGPAAAGDRVVIHFDVDATKDHE